MNNFTKEELEEIKSALEWTDISIDESLLPKVESMIDNYCEHESITQDTETMCFFRCDKCKVLIE